jgi:calcineurin-like phosphoesterase family protein
MATFFTADWHLSHERIIELCRRPFSSVVAMNDAIINRCNELVGPGDNLYHLGDFCWYSDELETLRRRIKCNTIHLIYGNHDGKRIRKGKYKKVVDRCFVSADDLRKIEVEEQQIVLCHYAMRVWEKSHYGVYHLYGHSHGYLLDDPHARSFDVGVDCWNFYPVSLAQVHERMAKKTWQPIDHHVVE